MDNMRLLQYITTAGSIKYKKRKRDATGLRLFDSKCELKKPIFQSSVVFILIPIREREKKNR